MRCFVSTAAVVSPLEGAVEVNAYAIARDARVLVCQRKDEGGIVAEADAALADAQAAFWLAEEHYIRWEREVWMVLKRVAT